MDNKISSYTAASSFPFKIAKNDKLVRCLNVGEIPPFHAQIIPTNRCNLNCKFCSCANRNKQDELTYLELAYLADELHAIGCQAVTITGGGEPLMHRDIVEIIQAFTRIGIQVGLVSNGLLLEKLLQLPSIDDLVPTWCRISCSDNRKLDGRFYEILERVVCVLNLDWAFSYVVSTPEEFDAENLRAYIHFANEHNFTHVRVVSDLVDLDNCILMESVQAAMAGIDDSRVIYQGRKDFTPGVKDCFISLLKPVIGADGYIYPCCGAQYAHNNDERDMSEGMRMGHVRNIREIYEKQKWFCGSECNRCYYQGYNQFLGALLSEINHKRFV